MSSRLTVFAIAVCGSLPTLALAAGNAGLEANVQGADGRPLKNAQVQIEALDQKSKPVVLKPDAHGHVSAPKIDAGAYRVSVILNGKVQISQKTKVEANKPTVVALKVPSSSTATTTAIPAGAKTKVVNKTLYVWVPGPTGSRFGGYWKEAGKADATDANGNMTTGGERMMENAQGQQRSSRSGPGQ